MVTLKLDYLKLKRSIKNSGLTEEQYFIKKEIEYFTNPTKPINYNN